ncbi:hypothetical protein TSTA_025640 [Talaromyces stipitatus ATCC 10500]|uniref:Uncharacterized protein n=1 Tax=Talaromyces stipitatus (strain ATCC 10500 / CBS 375.48 / QM 6759 / NRRL 1006) TaxID=441959 RepID=B8M4Q2_TALSN|nr:uncharacterized protein TSTA_025640 [Talaromyces stipitatus ATCC 10500]EED19247.1 hypothetical protein TSTA_025640 [Talaromyces stipitatus ATCC 10500]
MYGFTILTAVGTGLTLQIGCAVSSLEAPGQESETLTLQSYAQISGSVFALVIAGQVFQSYSVRGLTKVLAGTEFTKADIQSIVAGTRSLLFQGLDQRSKTALHLSYINAIQRVFISVCVRGAFTSFRGEAPYIAHLDLGGNLILYRASIIAIHGKIEELFR